MQRRHRPRRAALLGAALALTWSSACINVESERGVEARWKDLSPEVFVQGETTRAEVLELLGPPSQILSVGDGTAFYYLVERSSGTGLVLLVYNTRKDETGYDRAVFFFDASGILTDHAVSEAR